MVSPGWTLARALASSLADETGTAPDVAHELLPVTVVLTAVLDVDGVCAGGCEACAAALLLAVPLFVVLVAEAQPVRARVRNARTVTGTLARCGKFTARQPPGIAGRKRRRTHLCDAARDGGPGRRQAVRARRARGGDRYWLLASQVGRRPPGPLFSGRVP